MDKFPVTVVGGGPSGLIAALVLAHNKIDCALITPPLPSDNPRTNALMSSTLVMLDNLGIGDEVRAISAPLRGLRIVDATDRLIRAPEVLFQAAEIGLPALAYNVNNVELTKLLRDKAESAPQITLIEGQVTALTETHDGITLTTNAGTTIRSSLVGAADGRNSFCRQAIGIEIEKKDYDQSAIALLVKHAKNHGDVSTEFHHPNGPLTYVPVTKETSAIVWMEKTEEAKQHVALNEKDLCERVAQKSAFFLGGLELQGAPVLFPLQHNQATTFAKSGVALIGEAGHLFPPIGAQGLNLSLRDAATFAEMAITALNQTGLIDKDDLSKKYSRARTVDIKSRSQAVRFLNLSLINEISMGQEMRAVGLQALKHIAPLRKRIMKEGLAPTSGLPKIMQGAGA